ncbi:DUF6282 family protein [Amycolatopsis sp. GM8]|uniref:DUF6282 family protein n=1 Tax=Amycolatopsis sp. GM8 TaxID=2896530 RepID=UPI0027E16F96|nr:DUF6282 family protein [Amycolatopsis sp. GM8]
MIGSGIVDFHVHSAPSILPRRLDDRATLEATGDTGVAHFVLKAHEGSSAERAALIGPAASGGVVLNSPVGGCNPDAAEVAARLGGRIVWLPTISSSAHQAAATTSDRLAVHRDLHFREVPVFSGDGLHPELRQVLDIVAAHDLILASGHIPVPDAVKIFEAAANLGARRFLVNHPTFEFMHWSDDLAIPLRALDVRLEVGCVADLGTNPPASPTARLAALYPTSLLVFGSDLGHTEYPPYREGVTGWYESVEPLLGAKGLEKIMTTNGRQLLAA